MQHGDFTHIEIPADDPDRARDFYASAFGWSFAPDIPGFEGYHLFTTPAGENGMGGAIGKRGELAPEKVRAYVQVDSIAMSSPESASSAAGSSPSGPRCPGRAGSGCSPIRMATSWLCGRPAPRAEHGNRSNSIGGPSRGAGPERMRRRFGAHGPRSVRRSVV